MARRWHKISETDAAKHPLYGVKGWLALLSFGLVLGVLVQLGQIQRIADDAGMSLVDLLSGDDAASAFVRLNLAVNVVAVAAI